MKKLLIALIASLALVGTLTPPADAMTGGAEIVLNGVTTTTSATRDVRDSSITRVQVWSTAGSVATIQVECHSHPTAPWFPCVPSGIVNPDATGEYWSIPVTTEVRVRVSAWTSGSIFAALETHV